MPRGDGTGPLGQGPMTGRGAGLCAGYPTPGMGRGMGRGMGMGRGRFFSSSPQQELGMLKSQSEYFKSALDGVNKRISELEKD